MNLKYLKDYNKKNVKCIRLKREYRQTIEKIDFLFGQQLNSDVL